MMNQAKKKNKQMKIDAKLVMELRQKTGAGMMDCKKALVESNGDFDAAIEILRKKGQKVAAKRADREYLRELQLQLLMKIILQG